MQNFEQGPLKKCPILSDLGTRGDLQVGRVVEQFGLVGSKFLFFLSIPFISAYTFAGRVRVAGIRLRERR